MRIWCCLCFGEDEGEDDKGRESMWEGILGYESEDMENDDEVLRESVGERMPIQFEGEADKGRDSVWEGILGYESEDMENDEVLRESVGERMPIQFEGEDNKGRDSVWEGILGYESEDMENDDEVLRESVGERIPIQFEGEGTSSSVFAASSSGKGNVKDINLNLGLGEEPPTSSAAVEREGCDRDSYSKRPKVHSFSLDWDCQIASAASSEMRSRNLLRRDVINHNLMNESRSLFPLLNNGGRNDDAHDSGGLNKEGDEGNNEMEDLVVQMDLMDDLLHKVFTFLDQINLCRAALVCKQWRAASGHEDFWRFLNFENRSISLQQFDDMCRRYPNATQLNINGAPAIHSLVMHALFSLRNLEILTLGKGQLGETFFQALPDFQNLKSLIVNDAILGNGIQEIPIYHDRLCHLEIVKCRVVRISVRCPQLQTLSLKRSSMAQAVLNCPLLRDLDIASCHKLLDPAIRSATTSCPLLESLDMSNCSCVSDETLREIASACNNLRILNASYCPISLESVSLPMLTVLKLHSCEGITSASMAAIAQSSMLEVLELDNCSSLTSVSLELPRLQNIRLVHCRKFVELTLRSLVLSSIKVSNCPSLQLINITSNSLQKLVLQKQESLTALALHCQLLQEVDLTGCESLTNSICEFFSDGGGCPNLKSLVLNKCESLTAVRFCSTSLTSLSLAGCRAITSLELACPYLEQVSLDGCYHLENASFNPVGLHSLNLGICPKLNALNIEAPSMVLLELKGCGVLSEASIRCPLLTSLDASFCSQLKDNCLSATTSSCPLIESLILMSCQSIGYDGLLSLRGLPHLTFLDLSYTFLMNLEPIFETCSQLKVLKLQACKYLTDSSLEALYKHGALPSLQVLDLSYGTLGQSSIEELLAYCTHLTHMSLNGCLNMHDLKWSFSTNQISKLKHSVGSSGLVSDDDLSLSVGQPDRLLQNLNCVGCPSINRVLIPYEARCIHLTSLNLSLSANLREVDIACLNLCVLNLSNCCSLEILKLACPRLSSLFLQSCNISEEAVESAISQCNMLETFDVRFCPQILPESMRKFRTSCPSLKRIYSSLVQT